MKILGIIIFILTSVGYLQAREPANFKFTGLPSFLNNVEILDCKDEHDSISIKVMIESDDKASSSNNRGEASSEISSEGPGINPGTLVNFSISPWPDNEKLKKRIIGSKLKSSVIYNPTGPSRTLEFSKDGKLFLIIKSRALYGFEVLKGISIEPGGKIKRIGNRFWINTKLNSAEGKNYTAKHGEQLAVFSEGKKWQFLLFGASVPESFFTGTNGIDSNNGIAKEEPGFIADFIVYNEDW